MVVYHAEDVLTCVDSDIVDVFWKLLRLRVAYGNADYTLIQGSTAYDLLSEAAHSVHVRNDGVGVGFFTPVGLRDEGVFFAIRG